VNNTWQDYATYWDNHTAANGPELAVTGLGDTYTAIVGATLQAVAPAVVNSVADIGCGAGLAYPLIRQLWPDARYIGVDVSPALVAHCRRRWPDAFWSVVDVPHIPGPVAHDLVICHSVMTHIYPDDARAWLGVIRDALSDNGRASISIHTQCHPDKEWKGDIARIDYYPPYFEAMLKECGLSIAVIHEDLQRVYGVGRSKERGNRWQR
jgi:SAM-dependent methyltransferase